MRPETNAKVNFLEEVKEPAVAQQSRILIPKTAVVGGNSVFLMKDSRAIRTEIKTGKELWGQVEVTSGLAGGEQIVLKGLDGMTDGERIVLKK